MKFTRPRLGVLMTVLPLWGCAQSDLAEPPPEPGTIRITLTIQNDFVTAGEVIAHTTAVARVPVRDVMALASYRYRMTLVCPDDAACRDAVARIAADRTFTLGVEVDRRQRIPATPPRDASR